MSETVTGAHAVLRAGGSIWVGNMVLAAAENGTHKMPAKELANTRRIGSKRFLPKETLPMRAKLVQEGFFVNALKAIEHTFSK